MRVERGVVMMMRWLWLVSIYFLTSACDGPVPLGSVSPCGATEGRVVRVLDGDTVELEDGRRIRYLQVNTPELARNSGDEAECLAEEALELNEALVLNKEVVLEYDADCDDNFDRLLAFVWVDGRMVNRILIERGYARLLVIPPNASHAEEFEELEATAQELRAGIWGECE